MSHLHSRYTIGPGSAVVVTLDHQANVLLLDDHNYASYRVGRSYRYYGGWVTRSPFRLVPPCFGNWNVVVDLGGRAGSVRAGVRVV
jgi:hypothetical protein